MNKGRGNEKGGTIIRKRGGRRKTINTKKKQRDEIK